MKEEIPYGISFKNGEWDQSPFSIVQKNPVGILSTIVHCSFYIVHLFKNPPVFPASVANGSYARALRLTGGALFAGRDISP
jgi:hypothetical protein